MYEQFKIHFQENFQHKEGDKFLLAISGGIDSMVLLHLMSQLEFEMELAHCNFGLRGIESEGDMQFIEQAASEYAVKLHVKKFDTRVYAKLNKCSIQMAARELRYQYFEHLMEKYELDYLITAHHADDNLETFLINLSRGSGLDGLCGIPEQSQNMIRPLLPFSRQEIKTYAENIGVQWREDSSNLDKKYLRNKIRHDLIPLLKELNPSFMHTFSNSLKNLKGSKKIIDEAMISIRASVLQPKMDETSDTLRFKVSELSKIAENSAYLHELFYHYGFSQYEDIRSLIQGQSGKQIYSKSHRLLKNRAHLLLTPISDPNQFQEDIAIEDRDDSYSLGDLLLRIESVLKEKSASPFEVGQGHQTAYFDKDTLEYPLTVRKWKKGDYFYPLGMKGKKKLSKFFKDQKYSLIEKENIWLLCSGNQIIWVIGKRMDDRYKLSKKTKNILKASITI